MLKRMALAGVGIVVLAGAMPAVAAPADPATAQTPPPPAPAPKGRIRAVIVGVVNYKDAIASKMIGAWNDSVLIAETLVREGARPEDITLLVDAPEQAYVDTFAVKPHLRQTSIKPNGIGTRAAIMAALAKVAEQTQPGDEVLLSFSGHGMQQNESVPGNEPDGLDEVFMPYDTGAPDVATRQKIQNAILDDEIGAAIDAIRKKGGNVTYLADFCHSGDSDRGANGLPNGAPTAKKLKLEVRPPKPFTVADGKFVRDLAVETTPSKAGWGAYVGMLAVPSAESAKQDEAPLFSDSERAAHGLLTVYAMANWNNPRVHSYRDLANRVTAAIDGHNWPRPDFDGDLDRPLMGGVMKSAVASAGTGSWAVFYKPGADVDYSKPVKLDKLEMSAGQLQGVVEGTIIGLALPSQQGDKTILYGRVSRADAYKAILVPASYGKVGADRWNDIRDVDGNPLYREVRLVATIEQQPVRLDYRIALPVTPASPTPAQAAALAALKAMKPADVGASFVKAGADADLVLSFEKGAQGQDMLSLTQPAGRVSTAFGAIDLTKTMADGGANGAVRVQFTVGPALVRATRFSRLQRVLASPAMETGAATADAVNPAEKIKVEFHIERAKTLPADGSCPATAAKPFQLPEGGGIRVDGDGSEAGSFTFQRCDWLFIKVTNTGDKDVVISPLIFSPDGGIYLFDGQRWTTRDEYRPAIKATVPNRLRAKESGVLQYGLTDALQGARLRDDFVLLVSDVIDGVPMSYEKLAQCPVVPGPEDGPACAVSGSGSLAGTQLRNNGAAGTAIEDLIDTALVGSGDRSAPTLRPTSVTSIRYSWQTQDRK